MKKIGEILKIEREKKGLSVQEIGMTLKINPKILKAIEEGDTKNLPAKTFLRGFIRSYAQYLRLNADDLLKMFQESTQPSGEKNKIESLVVNKIEPLQEPIKKSKPTKNEKSEQTSLPVEERFSGKNVYTIIGSLLLIALIIFVAKMVDKYQKESHRVEIPAANPIVEPPLETSQAEPPGMSTQEVRSSPLPKLENSNLAPVSSVLPEANPEPKPEPKIEAKPEPKPEPKIEAKPEPKPEPVPETPVAEVPAKNVEKPVEVILEALNKVDIRYSFDGEKFETLTLSADELHTFKSKSVLQLEISDGGAVSLVVNGRDRGVPGTIGKPLKLSYPK